MKLSCTQENLNRGLTLVSHITSSRSSLPILTHVLIKTDQGRLRLSATDLEIGINTWIGAKIEKEGGITIPGRILSEFISANPDKTINLQVKEKNLNLQSDRYQANIKGVDVGEFPLIPEIKGKPEILVSSKLLEEAINQVVIAVALDESRPVLSGILLKIEEKTLKLVATDSYRLAEKTLPLEEKSESKQNIIIPAKTAFEVARILGTSSSENTKIVLAENQVKFVLDSRVEVVSRLLEGSFPNYEQIIPHSYETKVILDLDQFTNAVKVAGFFARESANNVKLKIDPKVDMVEILATASQVGDNVSKTKGQIEGSKTEVAFNSKFILDCLSVVKSPKISLELSGKLSPGVFRPQDSKNYLYIIMPLRTEE